MSEYDYVNMITLLWKGSALLAIIKQYDKRRDVTYFYELYMAKKFPRRCKKIPPIKTGNPLRGGALILPPMLCTQVFLAIL